MEANLAIASLIDFNPRTRVECDMDRRQLGRLVGISIHALV